jgi:hypothetical protein
VYRVQHPKSQGISDPLAKALATVLDKSEEVWRAGRRVTARCHPDGTFLILLTEGRLIDSLETFRDFGGNLSGLCLYS